MTLYLNTRTPESIAKQVATRHKNNSYKRTPEIITKYISSRKRNKENNYNNGCIKVETVFNEQHR